MNTELSLAMSMPMSGGKSALSCGHHGAHALGQVQRIGGGLADHTHRYGGAAIEPHAAAVIGSALLDPGHIAHACTGKPLTVRITTLAELRGCGQIGLRGHAELALLRLDASGGQLQIAAADGVFHVLRGQAISRQRSVSSQTRMAYLRSP